MNIDINGTTYPINVIRKNNKNTYIRVHDGVINVTTNYLESDKKIIKLINDNITSIERMINKDNHHQERASKFYYFGTNYDIIIGTFSEVDIFNDKIFTPSYKELDKWISKNIREIFTNRLYYWYNEFEENIPKPSLRLRKMTTRWGVCNTKSKVITLNTELFKYDIECLDYVVIHELSHLVHANHSKEFWNVVSKYCPNYKILRNKLKD